LDRRALVLVGASLLAGCWGGPSTESLAFNPSAASSEAMSLFDADHNGALDKSELAKSPGLLAAITTTDTNHDGALDAAEIKNRIEYYQGTQTSILPLMMNIRLDGQPLSGAEVRLVPEPFLEKTIHPATGTTSASGSVGFKVESNPYPGVNPGMYRVEISRKNQDKETLPAKYNTVTTLGQEIALDCPSVERGVSLELSSR
jgi:hypothetical protein